MDTEHLTEQHAKLVLTAQEILNDYDKYGPVLQVSDNLEYGPESAIERLRDALHD